tara:strand:- start:573 stop:1337 length:765 start_codon:yes stop_codon:yes gene_type:complete
MFKLALKFIFLEIHFMRKHIPNMITSANLLCGCLAILAVTNQQVVSASLLVLLGAFFDFFDGLSARLLKVSSPIGAQLDSLADVVTFGLVPSFIALNQLEKYSSNEWVPYFALLIAVFSAIRLAKFNVDDRQTDQFIGLPTPANALFWVSIPLIQWQNVSFSSIVESQWILLLFESPIVLVGLVVIFSYLLVAEIPLLALKFKSWSWKGNESRFLLLLFSVVLSSLFYFAAIPFILILYLILSIIANRPKSHEI